MQIHENRAADAPLYNLVTVCFFSEGETFPRQIVIEDVEEDVSEREDDSGFLPNTVRGVIFNGSLSDGFLIDSWSCRIQYIVHRVINIESAECYFPL